MTTYYVFCETHGRVSPNYNTAAEAQAKRKAYLASGNAHGRVLIIESYQAKVYGEMLEKRRKFK